MKIENFLERKLKSAYLNVNQHYGIRPDFHLDQWTIAH